MDGATSTDINVDTKEGVVILSEKRQIEGGSRERDACCLKNATKVESRFIVIQSRRQQVGDLPIHSFPSQT
ncbi:hypothetical protein [Pseudoxanthomonas sacheonensis]|uniref:hypothetical protein n=1 Tax=Pseudoxanthomonas sacheonensis TaxID=443615 RepID=UPI00286BB465|nr:hypothetical protein [Pseudoxanthomonas sacheonensis]